MQEQILFYIQLRDASASELIKTFKDADILLTNMATLNAEVLDGLENVKVLLRHGIGYDKVDVEAATRNGIIFANEATAYSDDVAEHAIMLILETFRKRKLQDKVLKRWIYTKEWSSEDIYPMHRMKGKTLGIIGCGNIGSLVLEKMRGFGMKILVCDTYLGEERYKELGIKHVHFDDVLNKSDIITIHVPVTEETRGMFHMDNVILSPHIAWYSEEGGWDIRYMIMDDVKTFLEGKPPRFVVNPKVFDRPGFRFIKGNA